MFAAATAGRGALQLSQRRLRGTTEFMTEEAVKPIITTAGQVTKMRAMARAVTGQDRKKR